MREEPKDCPDCGAKGSVWFRSYCGADVCDVCDSHLRLARCYCGRSRTGRNGRQELQEMGETIEPEDY